MNGKTKSRLLSGLLAVIMAGAYLPGAVYAGSGEDEAKAALDAANKAVTETKAAYDTAKSDYDTAVKARDAAEKKMTEAETAVAKAKQNIQDTLAKIKSDAQSALDDAKATADDAEKNIDAYKEEYNSAKAAYDATAAKYDMNELKKKVSAANASVTESQSALQNAEADEAAAQTAYDNAGRTFINEKAGADLSVEKLTKLYRNNSALNQYATTEKYEKVLASALTVDNLNKAADFVTECNELRAGHGLGSLQINYRLMCFSATSAAVSSQVTAHAVTGQMKQNAFPELNGILPTPSENLAWRYSDPFTGWYTQEKQQFQEYVASGNYPGLDSMTAYAIYQQYPAVYQKVGHYLNIIDPNSKITGFARSTVGGMTDQQSFAASTSYGENVTPAAFKTALASYTAGPKAALDSAKGKTQIAENNLAAAKAVQTDAVKALDDAEKDVSQKKEAMDAAQKKVKDAESTLSTAKAIITEATAALTKAKAIDLSSPSTYSSYQDLVAAVQSQKDGEDALKAAKAKLTECETALAGKKKAMDAAKAKYDTAVETQKKAEAESKKYKEGTISIENASVTGVKDAVYTGNAIRQNIKVRLEGKTLSSSDYSVTYSNNTNVGTATMTISGEGEYAGYVTKTFNINPQGTEILTVKKAKKAFTVKWTPQTEQTDGYQIQCSTNSSFKRIKKKATVKDSAAASKKIRKLKAKKKYYVRLRTFKTVYGTKYFSSWSMVKTCRTK